MVRTLFQHLHTPTHARTRITINTLSIKKSTDIHTYTRAISMHAAVHTHPVHTILLDHKHPDTMNHEAVHRPRAWLWECAPLDRQLVGHFVWSPSPLTLDISRSNRNPRRGLCETCASLVLERLTVEGALTVIFFSLSLHRATVRG